MQKNSLSLCMIVKDAEESVGRAIKSALAVVDEVVVVDTGSSDNTRLIVEGYGARVVDFPWRDDFAAARNAGLDAAYGDWILVLDADEVLEAIRPVEVSRMLSNDEALAYFLRVRNELPGRASSEYDRIRLFRNHPDIRYIYPIHEQISPALSKTAKRVGGRMLSSSLRLIHHGSVDREEQGKKSRNTRLLRKAIADYAGEPYFQYQMACEMAAHLDDQVLPVKGFGRMLNHLESAVRQVAGFDGPTAAQLGYGADLYARHADALLASGRSREALASAEEGLERHGAAASLRLLHGRALLAVAREQQAIRRRQLFLNRARDSFQSLVGKRPGLEPAPVSSACYEIYPLRYLGEVALEAGNLEAAREYFEQAATRDPSYTGSLCGLARLEVAHGRPREALQIYLKALKQCELQVEAWTGGAALLMDLGFGDNASSWLKKLSAFLPEHPDLLAQVERSRDAKAGVAV